MLTERAGSKACHISKHLRSVEVFEREAGEVKSAVSDGRGGVEVFCGGRHKQSEMIEGGVGSRSRCVMFRQRGCEAGCQFPANGIDEQMMTYLSN